MHSFYLTVVEKESDNKCSQPLIKIQARKAMLWIHTAVEINNDLVIKNGNPFILQMNRTLISSRFIIVLLQLKESIRRFNFTESQNLSKATF